jgi:mono/diheme cytochrome c family protein
MSLLQVISSRFTLRISHYAFLILALFLASCSLAEDVTPPPGYVPPQPTATPLPAVPKVTPSIARGAEVYAQNCTRCHGVTGNADGEMVKQINVPVPAFTDPKYALTTTPQRWFNIITNGNLDRFMPPWGETLSVNDRWHVIAYLYSLSGTADQLKAGEGLYQAQCVQCHGQTGVGDGPQASGGLPDFTSQAYMAAASNQQFIESLSQPNHTFKLSDSEQQSLVGYVRAFALDTQPPKIDKGTITGTLTNGTAGASLPTGQEMILRIFDNFTEKDPLTTTLQPDGTFTFTDLDLPTGRAFIVTTRYNNILYTSDVAEASADTTSYELPITIFETTTDPSVITIDRLHVVFDFQPGVVQVGELITISNSGDKTFASATTNGPAFTLPLPTGYTELTFQDGDLGDRYLQTTDGFVDTVPIAPGVDSRQILLSYKLPYTEALTFTQLMPYPVTALNLLVPDVGVTLTGANLTDEGVSEIQAGSGAFHTYSRADVKAGESLTFDLAGQPDLSAATTTTTTGSASTSAPSTTATAFNWRNLLIGLLSLALVGSIVAYWWVGIKEKAEATATASASYSRREALLDLLAQLDSDFESGKISEPKYKAKREKLKAELKQVLSKADRKPETRNSKPQT